VLHCSPFIRECSLTPFAFLSCLFQLLAQIKQLHRTDEDDDSPLPLHPVPPRRTLSPLASGSEEDEEDEDSRQQSGRGSQGGSSSRRGSNQMPQDRVPNFDRTGQGELTEVNDAI
jgi:hypothetical protein